MPSNLTQRIEPIRERTEAPRQRRGPASAEADINEEEEDELASMEEIRQYLDDDDMVSWAFGKNSKINTEGFDAPDAPRKQDLEPAEDESWSDSQESSSIDEAKIYGEELSEGLEGDFERESSNRGSNIGSGRGLTNLLDVTGA